MRDGFVRAFPSSMKRNGRLARTETSSETFSRRVYLSHRSSTRASRDDKSIDGTKSAKIAGVPVADLNISRRATDGYSTFEVLKFQQLAQRYLRPLYELVPICETLRDIAGELKGHAHSLRRALASGGNATYDNKCYSVATITNVTE